MAIQLQIRHGTNAENRLFVGAEAELSYDTEKQEVRVHDGVNAGGKILSVPVGTIVPYAGGSIPEGWLKCDGSTISRTGYAALFAAIGTAFGAGDGSTTFKIPALSSKLPMQGGTRGSTFNGQVPNITGKIGNICVSVNDQGQTPAATTGAFTATRTAVYGGNQAGQGRWIGYLDNTSIDASRSSSVYKSVSTVMPAAVYMDYIIKY